jgi:hypothetical protein
MLEQIHQQFKRLKGAPVLIIAAAVVMAIILWTAWFTVHRKRRGLCSALEKSYARPARDCISNCLSVSKRLVMSTVAGKTANRAQPGRHAGNDDGQFLVAAVARKHGRQKKYVLKLN